MEDIVNHYLWSTDTDTDANTGTDNILRNDIIQCNYICHVGVGVGHRRVSDTDVCLTHLIEKCLCFIDHYRKKKTYKTIKKDLEINKLDRNNVYDKILWRNLINVADPTYWDKIWLL